MSYTREQLELKTQMVDAIFAKLAKDGRRLAPATIEQIAHDFILSYLHFREEIGRFDGAHTKHEGEIIWTEKRSELITEFAESLNLIFAPLGGFNPGDASAYWSGLGLKRAEEFGIDFAKTLPGFIINRIHPSLKSTLTSAAYHADDDIDTSTDMGLWEAMSALYARETTGEANIFLVDGITSQYSILWNTELHTLRSLQMAGTVSNIWVHTLKPEHLTRYHSLLELKKTTTELWITDALDRQISRLLKNTDNWTKEDINTSRTLGLKVSGLTGPLKTVSVEKLTSIAHDFAHNHRVIKEIKQINHEFEHLVAKGRVIERRCKILIDRLEHLRPQLHSQKAEQAYHRLQAKLHGISGTPAAGSPAPGAFAKIVKQAHSAHKSGHVDLSPIHDRSEASLPKLTGLRQHSLFSPPKTSSRPMGASPTDKVTTTTVTRFPSLK